MCKQRDLSVAAFSTDSSDGEGRGRKINQVAYYPSSPSSLTYQGIAEKGDSFENYIKIPIDDNGRSS